MNNNTWRYRNKTYMKEENEDEPLLLEETSESFIENKNNTENLVTCPYCKDKFSPKDYLEHFDVCEKRLAQIIPVKPTIKIITNEEEEIPNFLERLKIIEKEEPEIPWITRIGRKPK